MQASHTVWTTLNSLALGLLAGAAASSGRPGEVGDGKDEEAVAVVRNTGQGVVPGRERRHQTEETTGLDHGRVGHALVIALDVTNSEQQEGQVEEEEQQEERHGGSQGAEEQNGREDEPTLCVGLVSDCRGLLPRKEITYHEEQTEGVIEHGSGAVVRLRERRLDVEPTGGQDDGKRQPETTIG